MPVAQLTGGMSNILTLTVRADGRNAGNIDMRCVDRAVTLRPEESIEIPASDIDKWTALAESDGDAVVTSATRPMGRAS